MAEPYRTGRLPTDPVVASDTEVARVTFFEDRAEVTRALRVKLPEGRSRLSARGLTLLVDDRTLACRVAEGEASVVASSVRRSVEDVTEASAEAIAALEAEHQAARARLARLDREIPAVNADGKRASAMMQLWAETAARVPSRAEGAVEELSRAYDELDARTTACLDELGRLRTEREEAQAELARVEQRLAQARAKKPRYEASAEIEVLARAEGEIAIEIVYRTPCALWRPEHHARLVRKDGKAEIVLTTYATVWQRTGEDWRDVSCRFSTARPAQSATPPLLTDDVLATRRKTELERKQLVVEAREQAIAVAGVGRGTRDVDEMPGVDDGGEAQWLSGRAPATIPSDGRPVRIEVGERTFAAEVARVAWPERSAAAHLRATATLPGPGPLLAGPVTLAREGEVVGRARVGFVGPGDTFELGFGVDDGLRVRRQTSEQRKTTVVTGTQHVERKVKVFVSNTSDESRALTVVERVPVSEVEDVLVDVERGEGARVDGDGLARFEIDVPARGTRELVLRYSLEAKSNVVLPTSFDV